VTDIAAVRAAMAGLKTSTIFGDVELRAADHQLVRPMVLIQVEKVSEARRGWRCDRSSRAPR